MNRSLTTASVSMRSSRRRVVRAALGTLLYVVAWLTATVGAQVLGWDGVRVWLARYGTAGLFFLGLAWAVWGVERTSQYYRLRQGHRAIWNPLDLNAWYYGRCGQKLNQSTTVLIAYTLLFLLALVLVTQVGGCRNAFIYELPEGGGQPQALAQTIKVQKVIRTKFVVNPYSDIRFEVPPIDDVKLQLNEVTEHAYSVGQGTGPGAGFGTGTAAGKVRFIRLEYSGGDWDQDFGVGADLNMLLQYGIRTGQRVAEKTESCTIDDLRNSPLGKSPPLIYLTGQKNISLSNREIKILREYLLQKHGMIFGDNGGSARFHQQFLSMMNAVLPEVRPVAVPLDDVLHRIPYQIPFLPYVAPHGGKEALGWWTNGRWVGYYHPGDIGDAWCDGHAGVKAEIWETCYQLGTNVMFYAHAEYHKWLEAQRKNK